MIYGMVNVTLINAFVVYAHNMRKQQTDIKLKRSQFVLNIARQLVTPFAAQRYIFPTLSKNIKKAIILCGFATDFHESIARNTEGYIAMSRKRGRCHLCDNRRDVEPSLLANHVPCMQEPYKYDYCI